MKLKYWTLLLLILMGLGPNLKAQYKRTEVRIDFRVNSTVLDTTISSNDHSLKEVIRFLDLINRDNSLKLIKVSFCGAASPEGSYQLNHSLSRGRMQVVEEFVRSRVDIPHEIITYDDSYIPWNNLIALVSNSNISYKEEVLAILNEDAVLVDYHHSNNHIDRRIVKLKQLDNGKVWKQMHSLFFASMRYAFAVIVTSHQHVEPMYSTVVIPSDIIRQYKLDTAAVNVCSSVIPMASTEGVYAARLEWLPKLHIKTNAIALGLGIANIAAEIDLAKHWSFTLPVYYSAWDYFKTTIKFRTFSVQPEFRYWLSENNDGFFAGAHFGLAYYNFAFDGDYRYQDHNRETPSIGGGVSVGYRLPVSKNSRWWVEFSLGAGVYSRHYDKFHNTPVTKDGLMIESIKKTYWGIDQAAVSFSYSFDLKKKGGKR